MRVFELSTRVVPISRSEGRSATASAAYRACCLIDCAREGRTHDYRRKQGLELAEIILPPDAPDWAQDRARLWNAAELREQNKDKRAKSVDKANARTAREFFFSFPVELSAEGRSQAARTIALHLVRSHGIAVDIAIHRPGQQGDERNFHCHMLTTTRRVTAKGLGAKARELDEKATDPVKQFRAFVAETLNMALQAEGKGGLVHVEHRSFKDRGDTRAPTQHQGPARTALLRKQQAEKRRAWLKQARDAAWEKQAKERAALKARLAFALQQKMGELSERRRQGVKAIREELEAQRRADVAPTGLKRLFQIVTGRAMRADFDRQTREGQRTETARQQLAALKAELRTERGAFQALQARELATLADRHQREERQLGQAVMSRETLDRAAERSSRREGIEPQARGHGLRRPTGAWR